MFICSDPRCASEANILIGLNTSDHPLVGKTFLVCWEHSRLYVEKMDETYDNVETRILE